MPPLQFRGNRLLVGEVLIERCDIDPRAFRDAVSREFVPAVLHENVSSGFQDGVHGCSRPVLSGALARFQARPGGHRSPLGMQVDNISNYLHYRGMITIETRAAAW